MADNYQQFLESKQLTNKAVGFEISNEDINPVAFDFQKAIIRWAVKLGRAAVFSDCGTGKSLVLLEWANLVCKHTGQDVLILSPLSVAHQTKREAEKFKIDTQVTVCKTQADVHPGINITNYEKLQHFDATKFIGVVLDESSILKAYSGKTRNQIIGMFDHTPYRLACTATPAPNDYMELGNHSEFIGSMSRVEMLSMFFVHDGGDTSQWRLKGHATNEFWKWLCSWAVMLRKPSDLGFEDKGFTLPKLNIVQHITDNTDAPMEGYLIPVQARTMTERRVARKSSLSDRVKLAAELANKSDEQWLIWCDLNAEGDALEKEISNCMQIAGKHDDDTKEIRMMGFVNQQYRVLVSKSSICGFGLNLQQCHNIMFVGLSDSYEQFYQAIRRCWRFGQTQEVNCHVITGALEGAVVANIQRKEKDAKEMTDEMVQHMQVLNTEALKGTVKQSDEYKFGVEKGDDWTAYLGDCVDVARSLPDDSIDYQVFSPPFASLYTYSNSERDMGNSKTYSEFFEHYKYLIKEQYRILRPGRLLSFHCMNLPTTIQHHGKIGIEDFRGDLIRAYQAEGFTYHSEVCIWKDPVTAMQRTKALGLLYKQLRKDSARSRQGIPDYLVTMRKEGENTKPVTKTHESFPVGLWQNEASPVWTFGEESSVFRQLIDWLVQYFKHDVDLTSRYAEAVWMDINPSDTLQRESAREEKDEKHIAPLQLEVIERAIKLWTNPGDTVFTPFLGIGSEAYVAVKLGRRGIGSELKESYWKQAVRNLRKAESEKNQPSLFDVFAENTELDREPQLVEVDAVEFEEDEE